jgi:hypothetical protein
MRNYHHCYFLKLIACICMLLSFYNVFSQEKVEWKEDYVISSTDFMGNPPKNRPTGTQTQRFFLNVTMNFSYNMNAYAFMFAKNFNKYVQVYFIPLSSWIEDGQNKGFLIGYAQLEFDLST